MKPPDIFLDFTTLKWVKYTERKPDDTICFTLLRFNGKNTIEAMFIKGKLYKMGEDKVSAKFIKEYKDTFYWLEEIIDVEGFSKANDLFYEQII